MFSAHADAFNAADAFVGYKVCCAQKPSGIYPHESFVYFISLETMGDKHVKRRIYEGKMMLQFKKQLSSYLSQDLTSISAKDIPYDGELGSRIKDAINTNVHIDTYIKNLNTHILVNQAKRTEAGNKAYHYVVAVPAVKLEKQRSVVNQERKQLLSHQDPLQIERIVRELIADAVEEGQYEDLMVWHLELGLFEDALYYQKKFLSKKLHLVNFYDSSNPYADRMAMRRINSMLQSNERINPEFLRQLPAAQEIINGLLSSDYSDDAMASIVLLMTMLVDTNTNEVDVAYGSIKEKISSINEKYPLIREYSQLMDHYRTLQQTENTIFNSSPLFNMVLRTTGHLMLAPETKDKETPEFRKARILFDNGRNPDQILDLLLKSLVNAPGHKPSWDYLGAILLSQKRYSEALIIYNQFYQLDNSNHEIMKHIAKCYEQLGLGQMAAQYIAHFSRMNVNNRI